MIFSNWLVQTKNNIGQRTEHCGTPDMKVSTLLAAILRASIEDTSFNQLFKKKNLRLLAHPPYHSASVVATKKSEFIPHFSYSFPLWFNLTGADTVIDESGIFARTSFSIVDWPSIIQYSSCRIGTPSIMGRLWGSIIALAFHVPKVLLIHE